MLVQTLPGAPARSLLEGPWSRSGDDLAPTVDASYASVLALLPPVASSYSPHL